MALNFLYTFLILEVFFFIWGLITTIVLKNYQEDKATKRKLEREQKWVARINIICIFGCIISAICAIWGL